MVSRIQSILLASFVAAFIIFFFGFVVFNVIPAPKWFQQPFPSDNPALAGLGQLESGTYVYPAMEDPEKMDEVIEQFESGPIFTLYINSGTPFSMTPHLIEELIRAFAAALIVSTLLSLAYTNLCCYSHRVAFVSLCGLFAATSCEPTYTIWYWRGCGTTAWMFMATWLGWTIAGFAIARMTKPWNDLVAGPEEK